MQGEWLLPLFRYIGFWYGSYSPIFRFIVTSKKSADTKECYNLRSRLCFSYLTSVSILTCSFTKSSHFLVCEVQFFLQAQAPVCLYSWTNFWPLFAKSLVYSYVFILYMFLVLSARTITFFSAVASQSQLSISSWNLLWILLNLTLVNRHTSLFMESCTTAVPSGGGAQCDLKP